VKSFDPIEKHIASSGHFREGESFDLGEVTDKLVGDDHDDEIYTDNSQALG
jgi:hypothetical protein